MNPEEIDESISTRSCDRCGARYAGPASPCPHDGSTPAADGNGGAAEGDGGSNSASGKPAGGSGGGASGADEGDGGSNSASGKPGGGSGGSASGADEGDGGSSSSSADGGSQGQADHPHAHAHAQPRPSEEIPLSLAIPDFSPQSLVGTILADHYEIMSLLGEGGMGAVYKARHVLMHKIVAIKMLHSHLVTKGTTLKRFQQEAVAVAQLSHPNIIAVHEFGVTPQAQLYMIMEYLEGHSLAATLEKAGYLPEQRALPIFLQISDALNHAHHKGIIHRDLKPSNIVLVQDEEHTDFVKIVDFGIAKFTTGPEAQHLTTTGEVFGSPLYMSPEQCMGQQLDERSDIYSFGCVMYEALVGQPPFKGDNALKTMYMRLTERPKSFGSVRSDIKISPQLEQIVFTAIAPEAQQRFQTMAELKDHLQALLPENQGRPGRKKLALKAPPKFHALLAPSKQFHREIVVILALLVVALAGVAAVNSFIQSRTMSRPDPLQQEVLWQQFMRDGQARLDQQDYREAEQKFRWALKHAESFGESDRRLVSTLEKLAILLREQGKDSEAEEFDRRISRLRQQQSAQNPDDSESHLAELVDVTLGLVPKKLKKDEWPNYVKLCEKLNHLAQLCADKQAYGKAEELLGKELELKTEMFGGESMEVVRTLDALADVYVKEGKDSVAEEIYEHELGIEAKALGSEHPNVAATLSDLAQLYTRQGRYSNAENLYEKSLAITEKSFGREHLNTATAIEGLAGLYRLQGRYAKSEPLYKDTLAIRQKLLGPDDRGVAVSLSNLAGLYASEGRFDKAEPLYHRAMAIYEKLDGPGHPVVAHLLNNVAVVKYKQHKIREAEPLFKRALAIRVRALPPDHPELAQSLNGLAEIYRAEGKLDEAELLLQQALEISKQAYGLEHPEVARVLNGLGELNLAQGQYDEAEGYLKTALEMREKIFGKNHPETATSMNDLASLYTRTGKYKEAEQLFQKALVVRKSVLGAEHPDTAASMDGYGDLLIKTNRLGDGIGFKAHAATVSIKNAWPFH